MSYDLAFLKKIITPELSALLIIDTDPPHPREHSEPITTIAAWHRRFELSDEPKHRTPDEFQLHLWSQVIPDIQDHGAQRFSALPHRLRTTLNNQDYPGFLNSIYIYNHSAIKLSTAPFNDTFDSGWVGWIYITPDGMKENGLDDERAMTIAKADLQELENYTNGQVYAIAMQRKGENDRVLGPIYTEDGGHPKENLLDEVLADSGELNKEERKALFTTEWKEAVRRITWEQE